MLKMCVRVIHIPHVTVSIHFRQAYVQALYKYRFKKSLLLMHMHTSVMPGRLSPALRVRVSSECDSRAGCDRKQVLRLWTVHTLVSSGTGQSYLVQAKPRAGAPRDSCAWSMCAPRDSCAWSMCAPRDSCAWSMCA
jgi:hypothetical protein